MVAQFLDMLTGAAFSLLNMFLGLLPSMPFSANDLNAYMQSNIVVTVLGWMNYFLPIGTATAIISAWAVAMMSYVGVKIAMLYGWIGKR